MPQGRDLGVMPIALENTQLCKVRWLKDMHIFDPHAFSLFEISGPTWSSFRS